MGHRMPRRTCMQNDYVQLCNSLKLSSHELCNVSERSRRLASSSPRCRRTGDPLKTTTYRSEGLKNLSQISVNFHIRHMYTHHKTEAARDISELMKMKSRLPSITMHETRSCRGKCSQDSPLGMRPLLSLISLSFSLLNASNLNTKATSRHGQQARCQAQSKIDLIKRPSRKNQDNDHSIHIKSDTTNRNNL